MPEDIVILGVNEAGYEGSNDSITDARDLPWLQDTDADAVWSTWGVTYRDVIVLDRTGAYAGVYNLTDNDLGEADKLAELEELLLSIE